MCRLRSLLCHRDHLLQMTVKHMQHMQQALAPMHLHLHHVMSDVTGVTGMRILRAVVAGERDPLTLAQYRDYRIQSSEGTIAKALRRPRIPKATCARGAATSCTLYASQTPLKWWYRLGCVV
jgi:hypothetical protein